MKNQNQGLNMILIGIVAVAWTTHGGGAYAQCPCDGDVVDTGGTVDIDINDVLTVYECAKGLVPPGDPHCILADVNCNGVVDTCDMSAVWCQFVGMTDCCGASLVCGACCSDGSNFEPCEVISALTCESVIFNGIYQGDGTTCNPNPCDCVSDADCVDATGCNTGVCGLDFMCQYTAVPNGTSCADGQFCNGAESCQNGACVAGAPPLCLDGSVCTVDSCDPVSDACVHETVGCNHDGTCQAPCETLANCPDDCACVATRDLSDSAPSYCPSRTKTVHLAMNVQPGTLAVGVEDSPPLDWTNVTNISDGGAYDPLTHKVKWGPFFTPFPAALTYDVIPPNAATGLSCFSGTVSVDGVNEPICGDRCVEELCCGYLAADDVTTTCTGCGDCSCAACADGRVELCEMIGYACAWKKGCNDDLSGMTRAAFIWVSGECYCWDEFAQNWFATPCAGATSSCCAGGSAAAMGQISPAEGTATLVRPIASRIDTSTRSGRGLGRSTMMSIDVQAPVGTSAMAMEYSIPKGLKVTAISDGGVLDGSSGKIKWGPFFEDLSRTVTFEVRGAANVKKMRAFSGMVSFDGVNHPIVQR